MKLLLALIIAVLALTGPGYAKKHHEDKKSYKTDKPHETTKPEDVEELPAFGFVAPPMLPPAVIEAPKPPKSFLEQVWDWVNK